MVTHSYEFWEYEKKELDEFLDETIANLGPIFTKHRLTLNQGILLYSQLQLQSSIDNLVEILNERFGNSTDTS